MYTNIAAMSCAICISGEWCHAGLAPKHSAYSSRETADDSYDNKDVANFLSDRIL